MTKNSYSFKIVMSIRMNFYVDRDGIVKPAPSPLPSLSV